MYTVKGLPSSYNKDLQEDKEPLFDCVITVKNSLQIATGIVSTLNIHPQKMKAALTMDMLATDLADYLVRKGVPFRETHHISGSCVRAAEEQGLTGIDQLGLENLQSIDKRFEEDVLEVFDFERSVELRQSTGGTCKASVEKQIAQVTELLQ